MRDSTGLGMVEVVLALMMLTLGVLAAFGMQTGALSGTRTATIAQDMSNIAQSELRLQREFSRAVSTPILNETCRSSYDSTLYSCAVNVYPCSYSLTAFECRNTSVTGAAARQVVIVVTGPHNRQMSAATVVK